MRAVNMGLAKRAKQKFIIKVIYRVYRLRNPTRRDTPPSSCTVKPCASPPAENLPNRRFPVRRRQPEHHVVHPLLVRPAGLPRRPKPREGTVHRQLQVGNVTVCSSAETVAGFLSGTSAHLVAATAQTRPSKVYLW